MRPRQLTLWDAHGAGEGRGAPDRLRLPDLRDDEAVLGHAVHFDLTAAVEKLCSGDIAALDKKSRAALTIRVRSAAM